MSRLTKKELRLLDMVQQSEEIQFYFFRKVKGLKWFDEFEKRGFLNPESNPKPEKSGKDNLYKIPTWDILEYLHKTADELNLDTNQEYVDKYLDFISKVTNKSKGEKSNYRTWWYFSQILTKVPTSSISNDLVKNIISVWIQDKFSTSLIVKELGENLLARLIKANHWKPSLILLELLTNVRKKPITKFKGKDFEFIGDNYQTKSFLQKNNELIGKLGIPAVKILQKQLIQILSDSENDKYNVIWRPAIENHEQNEVGHNEPKNILISSIRDVLEHIDCTDKELSEYVSSLFDSEFTTLKRIAIHQVHKSWPRLDDLVNNFIIEDYFRYPFRHELFNFLKDCFEKLNKNKQDDIARIINDIKINTDEKINEKQIAVEKLNWLVAIKKSSHQLIKKMYNECIKVAEREPENPDFSFYSFTAWGVDRSAVDTEEFFKMDASEIVKMLNEFEEDRKDINTPTEQGLAEEFLKAIKLDQEHFFKDLITFIKLRDLYLSKIVESFIALREKNIFDEGRALKFCLEIVKKREDFYETQYSNTISAICKYITTATNKDESGLNENCYSTVESILKVLLGKLKKEEYVQKVNFDPVTSAINFNRGEAIEALINYSLLRCRLENKSKGDHETVWNELKVFFDNEIKNPEKLNFEFHALVTRYLPNMIYLSREWVEENKGRIFSDKNDNNWLAAINGFSYSNYVNSIFEYLVDSGQYEKALDTKELKYESKQRFIKYAGINYLVSDNLKAIKILIERWNDEELSHLAWFIWTLREKSIDKNQKEKIINLWVKLFEKLKNKPLEKLLSNLNNWIVFFDEIDQQGKALLLQSAPFSDKNHNAYLFIEELKKHVVNETEMVAEIFIKMLEGVTPDYNREHICFIVENIYKSGLKDEAEQISKHYLSNKYSFVTEHLSALQE